MCKLCDKGRSDSNCRHSNYLQIVIFSCSEGQWHPKQVRETFYETSKCVKLEIADQSSRKVGKLKKRLFSTIKVYPG